MYALRKAKADQTKEIQEILAKFSRFIYLICKYVENVGHLTELKLVADGCSWDDLLTFLSLVKKHEARVKQRLLPDLGIDVYNDSMHRAVHLMSELEVERFWRYLDYFVELGNIFSDPQSEDGR